MEEIFDDEKPVQQQQQSAHRAEDALQGPNAASDTRAFYPHLSESEDESDEEKKNDYQDRNQPDELPGSDDRTFTFGDEKLKNMQNLPQQDLIESLDFGDAQSSSSEDTSALSRVSDGINQRQQAAQNGPNSQQMVALQPHTNALKRQDSQEANVSPGFAPSRNNGIQYSSNLTASIFVRPNPSRIHRMDQQYAPENGDCGTFTHQQRKSSLQSDLGSPNGLPLQRSGVPRKASHDTDALGASQIGASRYDLSCSQFGAPTNLHLVSSTIGAPSGWEAGGSVTAGFGGNGTLSGLRPSASGNELDVNVTLGDLVQTRASFSWHNYYTYKISVMHKSGQVDKIEREFSDFERLRVHLCERYFRRYFAVPVLPPGDTIANKKVYHDPAFQESRCRDLTHFLQVVLSHAQTREDAALRQFIKHQTSLEWRDTLKEHEKEIPSDSVGSAAAAAHMTANLGYLYKWAKNSVQSTYINWFSGSRVAGLLGRSQTEQPQNAHALEDFDYEHLQKRSEGLKVRQNDVLAVRASVQQVEAVWREEASLTETLHDEYHNLQNNLNALAKDPIIYHCTKRMHLPVAVDADVFKPYLNSECDVNKRKKQYLETIVDTLHRTNGYINSVLHAYDYYQTYVRNELETLREITLNMSASDRSVIEEKAENIQITLTWIEEQMLEAIKQSESLYSALLQEYFKQKVKYNQQQSEDLALINLQTV